MKKRKKVLIVFAALLFLCNIAEAQKKPTVSISGTIGASYEGYGLSVNPSSPVFYTPRKPWNQFRFNIAPTFSFGKNFSLPLNFNFATKPTNFAGPYAGIGSLGKQSLGQFITNPINNFSINPKYKWAELQLGTQYLNYSDLCTGDIGVFGAGVDLNPKNYIIKFFIGNSQQGINYSATPYIAGAYKQSNWMAQVGLGQQGKFKFAFTAAKGKDYYNSATPPPPGTNPHENFVFTYMNNIYFKKGFYTEAEIGQGYYTMNTNDPDAPTGAAKSVRPFLTSKTSTVKDWAAAFSAGKKSANFDIGFKGKYLGAGYYTMGYPYQQSDRLDLTMNTRFNAWKDKKTKAYKMNVVASAGNRVNNMSNTTLRANQFIGNLNWFTQFSEKFSLNITYNNFGFKTNGNNILGIPSVKNVSNDIGISPSISWNNTKMNNLLTLSYNYSKYDETVIVSNIPVTTNNNTHTALLTYIPTYFTKKITPDFSAMYFLNTSASLKMQLLTLSAGLGLPPIKDKIKMKGQLQYTFGKTASFSANNNFIASMTVDYDISKKLKWNTFLSTNYFKYGNELGLTLIGANYLESNVRTGLTYRWK